LLTKDTQKQLSRVDGEIPTTAKPLKAKPIMPVVRNEKSIPVASNQVRISALHTETKGLARQSKKSVQALFTTLDDAKSLFDRNAAIFLDGRPAVDYEAEHIQGAISLYTEDVDDLYGKVLGNVSKDKVIVTYCSDPECTEATKLADILATKGFTKVVILLEGLPGWKEAGYPTAKAKESK